MKLKNELEELNMFSNFIDDNTIRKRVEQVLRWNVKKSILNKKLFYTFSILLILLNASIPIVNQIEGLDLAVTIISSIGCALTSILTLINFKEGWYRYRLTAEIIKSECMKLSSKQGEYDNENRENIFFMNFENIISEERSLWENNRFKNRNSNDHQLDEANNS